MDPRLHMKDPKENIKNMKDNWRIKLSVNYLIRSVMLLK